MCEATTIAYLAAYYGGASASTAVTIGEVGAAAGTVATAAGAASSIYSSAEQSRLARRKLPSAVPLIPTPAPDPYRSPESPDDDSGASNATTRRSLKIDLATAPTSRPGLQIGGVT